MNVISGAARAARNAVGVLRDAGEGAWSWTNSKLRQQMKASEGAKAGLEGEPQITTKPESELTTSEVSPVKVAAAAKSALSEVLPVKKAAGAAKTPVKKAAAAKTPAKKAAAAKTPAKKAAAAKTPARKA